VLTIAAVDAVLAPEVMQDKVKVRVAPVGRDFAVKAKDKTLDPDRKLCVTGVKEI